MRTVLDSMREPAAGATHIHQAVGAQAQSLTSAGANARMVYFGVSGGALRVRFDGTAPTAAVGILLSDGGVGTWSAGAWRAAKVVAADGTPVIDAPGVE